MCIRDSPVASVSGRIIPSNDFYDYEAKYISNQSELKIPSGSEAEEEIRKDVYKRQLGGEGKRKN